MICVFKNKRSAGANGLLGEGGQDPHSEERELRKEEGEKGRECTSAQRARPAGVGLLQRLRPASQIHTRAWPRHLQGEHAPKTKRGEKRGQG